MIHTTKVSTGFALLAIIALLFGGCKPAGPVAEPKGNPAPKQPDAQAAPDGQVKSSRNEEPTQTAAGAPEEIAVAKPADEASAPATGAGKTQKSNKVLLGSPELTAGIPGQGPLKLQEIQGWLADPKNHETLEFELPLGLAAGASQVKGVDKNALTRAKIELGRQLYFDPRLSSDATISCASCHNPDEGYAAHSQFGVGVRGQLGGRNSPVSYNRILSDLQFWDGRADSLEAQAVGPIANPIEMSNTHEACVSTIEAVEGYRVQFEKIFGEVTIENVGQAIASFERAIVTGPSPFDYYEQYRPFIGQDEDDLKEDAELYAKYKKAQADADAHPMSDSAKRGRDLFFGQKASCTACHVGANFTDEKYHNLGIGMDREKPDIGRQEVTGDEKDRGAFKTPTIRNVVLSAPYMHDGSVATLKEVVEWYAKGGHPNPNLSDKIKKLDVSDQDKEDLVAFMEACTGDFPNVERDRLPE